MPKFSDPSGFPWIFSNQGQSGTPLVFLSSSKRKKICFFKNSIGMRKKMAFSKIADAFVIYHTPKGRLRPLKHRVIPFWVHHFHPSVQPTSPPNGCPWRVAPDNQSSNPGILDAIAGSRGVVKDPKGRGAARLFGLASETLKLLYWKDKNIEKKVEMRLLKGLKMSFNNIK